MTASRPESNPLSTPRECITVRTDIGPVSVPSGSTLASALYQLVAQQGTSPDGVATAVNGQFVPRHARASHILQEGDEVMCFSPITGG